MADAADTFVAECFWPGVSAAEVDDLDARVRAAAGPVRYLGSILIPEDEVVLCQFQGRAEAVRAAAERAGVPFARILSTRLGAAVEGAGELSA